MYIGEARECKPGDSKQTEIKRHPMFYNGYDAFKGIAKAGMVLINGTLYKSMADLK